MKNCLHIWLDVTEDDVRRYSTALLRRDMSFSRIHVDQLYKGLGCSLDADSKISELYSVLLTKTNVRANTFNNYAVDDEIDEMKRRFMEVYPVLL